MRRFVILAVPRTGSNLLCTLLNSHPQILCHHEVFNPQGVFTALGYRGDGLTLESLQQRDNDPLGFLQRVWQTGLEDGCVGFKWTRGQNQDVLNNVVEDGSIKKIVLRRRNRIKTYVSELIAQETQQWEVYSQHELALPRPRIHVDASQLNDHIAINQHFYADLSTRLLRYSQPSLEVDFETLFDPNIQSRLLEFLAVTSPELALTAASVKQNPTNLSETIANFDELADELAGGELLAELYDRGM